MKIIRVNGEDQQIGERSLAELIAKCQQDSEGLVVEFNRSIIKEADWGTTLLQNGDVIEMLRFVGGG